MENNKIKVALIGTRGIPANHGGFETCVEEIGRRLVDKGHKVWVYSKPGSNNQHIDYYLGMKIVRMPRVKIQGFETLLSTIISAFHSLFFNFDMHMVFNGANSPALLVYKLFGKRYALNTDGLEWQREKWGVIGRNYYKLSERVSVALCKNLVSDSNGIHDYYKKKYNASSTIIAYGANIPPAYPEDVTTKVLSALGLERKKYFLQITRFEPENNPLLTLKAFTTISTDFKCVIIGGANHRTAYMDEIEKEKQANPRIILPGFIYEKEKLDIIWQNAWCYIHGNGVGGTNPALLQAMAAGRPVIALDCIFNREVLGEFGLFFKRSVTDLSTQMKSLLENVTKTEDKSLAAVERIRNVYNWELITNQYEALFRSVGNKS